MCVCVRYFVPRQTTHKHTSLIIIIISTINRTFLGKHTRIVIVVFVDIFVVCFCHVFLCKFSCCFSWAASNYVNIFVALLKHFYHTKLRRYVVGDRENAGYFWTALDDVCCVSSLCMHRIGFSTSYFFINAIARVHISENDKCLFEIIVVLSSYFFEKLFKIATNLDLPILFIQFELLRIQNWYLCNW